LIDLFSAGTLSVVNKQVVVSHPDWGCAGLNRHVVGDERAPQERRERTPS
jgi:hypothetical protein